MQAHMQTHMQIHMKESRRIFSPKERVRECFTNWKQPSWMATLSKLIPISTLCCLYAQIFIILLFCFAFLFGLSIYLYNWSCSLFFLISLYLQLVRLQGMHSGKRPLPISRENVKHLRVNSVEAIQRITAFTNEDAHLLMKKLITGNRHSDLTTHKLTA